MADNMEVYYKCQDDTTVLLGVCNSGGHNGIYEQGSNYVLYNDGYYEVNGIIYYNISSSKYTVTFSVPFNSTDYTVTLTSLESVNYSIAINSKTVNGFVASCLSSGNISSLVRIKYVATGRWK